MNRNEHLLTTDVRHEMTALHNISNGSCRLYPQAGYAWLADMPAGRSFTPTVAQSLVWNIKGSQL